MDEFVVRIAEEIETRALGRAVAGVLGIGDVILLEGPLGAGKTTLARAVIQTLCGTVSVPSPTFTLVETYETERFSLWHFDLYRLENPEDVWELGLEEAFENGASLIEWPDRVPSIMLQDALRIRITDLDGAKIAILSARAAWGGRFEGLTNAIEESD